MTSANIALLHDVTQTAFCSTLDWQVREDGNIGANTGNIPPSALAEATCASLSFPKGSTGIYVGESTISFDPNLLQAAHNVMAVRDPQRLNEITARYPQEAAPSKKTSFTDIALPKELQNLSFDLTEATSITPATTGKAKESNVAVAA